MTIEDTKVAKDLVNTVMGKLCMEKLREPRSTVSDVTITLICEKCCKEQVKTVSATVYRMGERRSHRCATCCYRDREEEFLRLCPLLYQESNLDMLPAWQLKQVLAWRNGPRGLLLIGDSGTGKTRIAWTLLRRVLCESKVNFAWFDCVSFGHEISRQYRQETAEDWLESLSRKDLVFFDDLGKLKITERAESELFGLVERRSANLLPIIATTNDTGDTLASRMTDNRGPALIRRLRDFCDVVTFDGIQSSHGQ